MVGIEAGGRGTELGEHAARLGAPQGYTGARPGVLQGTYTYVLQDADGQIAPRIPSPQASTIPPSVPNTPG